MKKEITTFADLGISFPLFEAPLIAAPDYVGIGSCSLCRRACQHCFRLGIGDYLIIECPACQATNGLPSDERKSVACHHCGQSVPFPDLGETESKVCYDCLRRGKVALTKDTELGMITWKHALSGITDGIPGLEHPEFELVITYPAENGVALA